MDIETIKLNDLKKQFELKDGDLKTAFELQNSKKSNNNIRLKRFSSGNINATVWKNIYPGKDSFLSFSIQKNYINKEGKWEHQNLSFKKSDLIKLESIFNELRKYMYMEIKGDTSRENG